MQVGEIYLCKLTGRKYRIAVVSNWGHASAANIDDPMDTISIASTDIPNGHYILFEPSPYPVVTTIAVCNEDSHWWRPELNFQFETEYCRRCGIKRQK